MKKLLMILVMGSVLFAVGNAVRTEQVEAADVVLSITVEDAYVDGLTEMVNARWMGTPECAGLSVKRCYAKKGLAELARKDYLRWKKGQRASITRANNRASKAADAAASAADEFGITGQ